MPLALVVVPTFAQCTVNGEDIPCDQMWAQAGPIFIFAGIIGLICFAYGIFWLWMFIDCLKRDFKDKVLWIVLLLVVNFPCAILYLFMVKNKKMPVVATPVAPATPSMPQTPQA